jgi:hypothetical protein
MSVRVTFGADPCVNSSFCAACHEADQRKVRGGRPRHIDVSIWNRRLARNARDYDSTSLEQFWDLFNRECPTPEATIEAITYCVRAGGTKALHEPANLERLSRCDDAALAQIDARMAKLKRSR